MHATRRLCRHPVVLRAAAKGFERAIRYNSRFKIGSRFSFFSTTSTALAHTGSRVFVPDMATRLPLGPPIRAATACHAQTATTTHADAHLPTDARHYDLKHYQHSHHIGPDAVGRIHSCDSFTTLDGPGNRFLLFLQGCAMRCVFCSNRDTWAFDEGKMMTVQEVVEKVKRVAPYLKANRGGITVSGGEPMLQPTFVASLFDEIHKLGLTTCIDTNGRGTKSHHWDVVLPRADYVLFCIKHMDPVKYEKLTHLKQDPALQFAEELARRQVPYILRYVYLPGWTDDPKDMDKLVEFAKQQPSLMAVELLPYHVLGRQKWLEMGVKYPLDGVPLPEKARVREEVAKMEAAGLKVLCSMMEAKDVKRAKASS